MTQQIEPYSTEYKTFISNYKRGQVSGEEIGEVITRMAQYFAEKNMILGVKDDALHQVAAKTVQQFDDNTGKPISVAKADLLIKATEEFKAVKGAKVHLENIEQFINALKYLQKGVLNEYAHMS